MKTYLKLLLLSLVLTVAARAVPTLHLIGDSTVCTWPASAYPKMGWGQVLGRLFVPGSVVINNRAVSGTSSKSFYENAAWWPSVRGGINRGDYLFIQFGHNDEKTGTGHTDPWTTYQGYLARYIDEAKARGAYPILVTPVERNLWSGGVIVASHGEYPAAMRSLATARAVPLIDLTVRSTRKYRELGQSYSTYSLFMNLAANAYVNYPAGQKDNTHFQENGAKFISVLVTEGIRAAPQAQMVALEAKLR